MRILTAALGLVLFGGLMPGCYDRGERDRGRDGGAVIITPDRHDHDEFRGDEYPRGVRREGDAGPRDAGPRDDRGGNIDQRR